MGFLQDVRGGAPAKVRQVRHALPESPAPACAALVDPEDAIRRPQEERVALRDAWARAEGDAPGSEGYVAREAEFDERAMAAAAGRPADRSNRSLGIARARQAAKQEHRRRARATQDPPAIVPAKTERSLPESRGRRPYFRRGIGQLRTIALQGGPLSATGGPDPQGVLGELAHRRTPKAHRLARELGGRAGSARRRA